MNYKLEKFWNSIILTSFLYCSLWTINLKSFEITLTLQQLLLSLVWTINLKSFEIPHNISIINGMLNEL